MADGTSASPAPYLLAAEAIRARIADGTWRPGDRLPSRTALGRELGGIGENVVRRAQELLVHEGLLEGRAGSGTYVRAADERHTLRRTRRAGVGGHTVAPAGFPGTWDADSEAKVPAPAGIALRLGVAEGAPCVRTLYEFLLPHRPALLMTSWEPMSITGGTLIVLPEGGPFAGAGVPVRMDAIKIKVVRVRELPRAVQIDREQAHLLGLPAGSRATLIERTHYDTSGRAVETADLLVPANQWEIAYEFPIETPGG